MTKEQKKWHELNIKQAMNRLGISRNQYNYLKRLGERLRKIYENNCNGDYKTEQEYDEAEREIIYKINVYKQECEELLYAYFQTDPRGASLYLNTEPMTDSNYTNGVCIY